MEGIGNCLVLQDQAVLARQLYDVEMLRYCEQCGRCSSACPLTGEGGFNIRRLIRHVELGLIHQIAGSSMPWFCATCGRCEEACPNGVKILDLVRILRGLSPKELHPLDPVPCIAACPAGIDIPGYMRLTAQGKIDAAHALIMERVPFPGVLGRVCPRPCETACKRGAVNQAVSICAIKRYVADHRSEAADRLVAPGESGKHAAVIGAGPAGLSAAYFLRKKGHRVTIFESKEQAGGMLRYGIPAYRLPQEVVEGEIRRIVDLGIELKTGITIGRDLQLDQLKDMGFDALFVSVGTQHSRQIHIEGMEHAEMTWGLGFLMKIRENNPPAVGEKVVVIGGGNVAVDVALSAYRLGAGKVSLVCLEKRDQMPANEWDIELAASEGVEMLCARGPKRIVAVNGRIKGVELKPCTSVFDAQGNFCPCFGDTCDLIPADQVILAIGQAGDTGFCKDFTCYADQGELRMQHDLVVVDPNTQATSLEGVFAGGDVAAGPGSVVNAIAAGRRAAESIDRYLGGDGIGVAVRQRLVGGYEIPARRERGFSELPRESMKKIPLSERHRGFDEVEMGLEDSQAVAEARRCLQCDLERCLVVESTE